MKQSEADTGLVARTAAYTVVTSHGEGEEVVAGIGGCNAGPC